MNVLNFIIKNPLASYLQETPIMNFSDPAIANLLPRFQHPQQDDIARMKAAFEFVRDHISHSFDINAQYVSCTASEVLEAKHGICYAKSHLLAAILRGMGIPSGLCYQRQVFDETLSNKMCLHAINAAYSTSLKRWIRFDARGNKTGVDAQFSLEKEQLAFPIREALGEKDYPDIHAEPLPCIVHALKNNPHCDMLRCHLPEDIA
jgi:transglutaminase-like putative cysteine protease